MRLEQVCLWSNIITTDTYKHKECVLMKLITVSLISKGTENCAISMCNKMHKQRQNSFNNNWKHKCRCRNGVSGNWCLLLTSFKHLLLEYVLYISITANIHRHLIIMVESYEVCPRVNHEVDDLQVATGCSCMQRCPALNIPSV